jgi:hypothetical protein
MNMKRKLYAVLAILALFVVGAPAVKAQSVVKSATFTFGPAVTTTATCFPVTMWNGVTNAYPEDMGAICPYQGDSYGGYGSFLSVPWQLGFLNNGYLAGCNPMIWGQKTPTNGDGTHAGDTFTQPATTTCPYYTTPNGVSVGFNIVGNFTVVKHTSCGRYGCRSFLSNVLTGGTGVVEETQN